MAVILYVCLLLLATSPVSAQLSPQADQAKILALENVWNRAVVQKDVGALNQLLADGFVATGTDGSFMNKAQFINSIRDKNYHPQQMLNETVNVHPHANFSIATGIYRERGTDHNKPYDIRARFTDVWALENGEWRCVSSHATQMPARKRN